MKSACACQNPPFDFRDYIISELQEDSRGAEVSVATCKACRLDWLQYQIEEPQFSRSGRWWRAAMTPEVRVGMTAEQAKAFIEAQSWCFVGGSYFDSTGRKVVAPIRVD